MESKSILNCLLTVINSDDDLNPVLVGITDVLSRINNVQVNMMSCLTSCSLGK